MGGNNLMDFNYAKYSHEPIYILELGEK